MHKARAFFFVCAGLLCLALAYHLGARSAGAQGSGAVECASFCAGEGFAVVNHHLYVSTSGTPTFVVDLGEIPSPARAIACGSRGVVLENGTVYERHDYWRQIAALPFGSPTPAVSRPTWGQLKAKYATPAPGNVTR